MLCNTTRLAAKSAVYDDRSTSAKQRDEKNNSLAEELLTLDSSTMFPAPPIHALHDSCKTWMTPDLPGLTALPDSNVKSSPADTSTVPKHAAQTSHPNGLRKPQMSTAF